MSPAGLGPGALADRLSAMPLEVAGHAVETGPVEVPGYYDGAPRPKAVVVLAGRGAEGRGECVAWTAADQAEFARAVPHLAPPGRTTVGALAERLAAETEDPYWTAAIEAASIDLALAQAGTDMFEIAARPARPVRHCHSIGAAADPLPAMEAILRGRPDARFKLDCPEDGWSDGVWAALAAGGRVVVVDFKRGGAPDRVAEAHRRLPDAWLEDPPREAAAESAPWAHRSALDGWVTRAADLDDPPLPVAAVNVKAPRVGGPLEALRILEACAGRGLHAYIGGMFEVDVGRTQARVLASLYTADAWNDLAPLAPSPGSAG